VFANRLQNKLFGSIMEEVAGSLRKLYNQNIQNLYKVSTLIESSKMRCVMHVSYMVLVIFVQKILLRKNPKG
jgi:hypothetical protein